MNNTDLYCPQCGKKRAEDDRFCSECGYDFNINPKSKIHKEYTKSFEEQAKDSFDNFVDKVNVMAGGESGQVDLKLRDLFINVFKKHTVEEREELFICGTAKTTPKESEISIEWPKPWLYSRVFIMFAVTFFVLVLLLKFFRNPLSYPGIIFIGALTIPFSLLVFFWEVNAPRNINIFDVIKIFFIGGVFSLLVTLILYSIFNIETLDYVGAMLVGVIEEVAKLVVIAYFLRGKKEKYILNGILIGAAVGAGFAVFETAGYIFNIFLYTKNINLMMHTIYLRGILSSGGHIAWASIIGAALVMVKGNNNLTINHIEDPRFLRFFIIPIILHCIWDMPISNDIVYIILTVIEWIIILVFINVGLKQIGKINESKS